MSDLASMERNYAASAGAAVANYNAAKGNMGSRWREGMARLGVTPGPRTTEKYERKISGAQFRMGDPGYFINRFREGVSR